MIEIEIKYAVMDGDVPPVIIDDEEKEKKYSGKVKVLKTKWSRQNWKLSNDLTRESMSFNGATGEPMVDVFKLRDLRIKKFLKSWDLKDPKGQDIPCNAEWIDQLHPSMASHLIDKYNEVTLPDEDQKN